MALASVIIFFSSGYGPEFRDTLHVTEVNRCSDIGFVVAIEYFSPNISKLSEVNLLF